MLIIHNYWYNSLPFSIYQKHIRKHLIPESLIKNLKINTAPHQVLKELPLNHENISLITDSIKRNVDRMALAETKYQEKIEGRKNTTFKEIPEVTRPTNVGFIADNHGHELAFDENIKHLKLMDENNNWTGEDTYLVLLGDNMGDRGMSDLEIKAKTERLRIQAREKGGDVIDIAGNHDDIVISFLMDKPIAGTNDFSAIQMASTSDGDYMQGKGLLALKYFGSDDLKKMNNDDIKIWEKLEKERELILTNMRSTPEGMFILEAICKMKLTEQIDDSLAVHTNPTEDIVGMILRYGPDIINQVFQTVLRKCLIQGESFNGEDFDKDLKSRFAVATDIFLNTNNRTNFTEGLLGRELAEQLRQKGINRIPFGHSSSDAKTLAVAKRKGNQRVKDKYNAGGLELIPLDFEAFKNGTESPVQYRTMVYQQMNEFDARSIARIDKNTGKIAIGRLGTTE